MKLNILLHPLMFKKGNCSDQVINTSSYKSQGKTSYYRVNGYRGGSGSSAVSRNGGGRPVILGMKTEMFEVYKSAPICICGKLKGI